MSERWFIAVMLVILVAGAGVDVARYDAEKDNPLRVLFGIALRFWLSGWALMLLI